MPNHLLFLLIFGSMCIFSPVWGFSPYENYLHSGETTHVALLAEVRDGGETALFAALNDLAKGEHAARLARFGIFDVAPFYREIGDNIWVVVYFAYEGGRDYLSAASAFTEATAKMESIRDNTQPHPRAERLESHWLQMEWISFIRGRDVPGPPADKVMIVTTIKPEKEETYRTLHQTVWPGVVDQVIRSNNRNLSIFLVTIDDQLIQFLYVEYVGEDPERDHSLSQSDEVNLRWWELTDACQEPLPGVEGIWDAMIPIPSESENPLWK